MKRLALALCVAVVATPALEAQDSPATSARRRVAVLDFDYAAVHSSVARLMGSDVDVGKNIVVLLMSALARNGAYTVIERAQVDRLLNEQNFQQNARSDASSAAKLGKLLGADAIIIGAVTQFDRQNNSIALGLKKETKATVVINARIVGMGTGEILAVAEGKGESKASQMNTDDNSRPASNRPGDVWSANFGNTILGEATRAAVDSMVIQLVAAAPKIPTVAPAMAALVADVSGDQLIINLGTAGGVRVGAEYAVARPGREIKDPATGNVLRRTTTPVGKIKITSADEGSAVGTLTGDSAHVGDCVGVCPLAPAARPPAQVVQGPALAGSLAGSGAMRAPPPVSYNGSASGPFTWRVSSFAGTEHFRYEVQGNMGASQSGFYEIDASPAEGGRVALSIKGQVGSRSYATTATLGPNEPLPAMQLSQLGPASILFTYGNMFSGRQWQLGQDLSNGSSDPSSSLGYSMKAESTCQHAGVQGLDGVMRQSTGTIIAEVCVSPNVALPLAVTRGSGAVSTALTLTEFRP